MLASRIRANIEGYLEHIPLDKIAQALDGAGGSDPATGKCAGLLLEAAANSYEYSDDAQLKKVMDTLAQTLISHQQASGYIGTYSLAQRWSHDDLSSQGALLLALETYNRVTGKDEALVAAKRLANPLVDHLSKGKGAVADAREVLRPLLELYRSTSDGHYLSFCRRLAQSSLSELGTETDTNSFLSFLSGLLDLYQLTGDEAFAKAAEAGWRSIQGAQLSVTGVPMAKDPLATGCVTQTWLQLNLDLFRVRGEARYAEQVERTVYNQLLAAQDAENGRIDPCVPANGSKTTSLNLHPCAAAIALGISEIPEMVWGRLGSGVAVLSYQPGHATLRIRRRVTLQLYAESEYPEAGKVLLHVEPDHDAKFPLQLLVPSWARSFRAEIGATALDGKPGQFLTLDREWKKGDTIKVAIEMSASAVTDSHHSGEAAIRRGPQILCLIKGDGPVSDLSAATISTSRISLKAEDDAGTYILSGNYAGRPQSLTLVPFSDTDTPYRLWIKASD